MTCPTCNGNQYIKRSDTLTVTCPDCCDPANEPPARTATPMFSRTHILDTAAELTYKTRDKEYGSASQNFKDIADLWSSYLDHTVCVVDVAIMMNLLKVARLKRNPQHRDSWIDGCGYLALGGELSESGDG